MSLATISKKVDARIIEAYLLFIWNRSLFGQSIFNECS